MPKSLALAENLLNCQKKKSIFFIHSHKICWANFSKWWANFVTYDLRKTTEGELLLLIINSWTHTHSHAASVRSHGLEIDAQQRAELQLWLVHKRFGWAYLCACVRSRRDWLSTKQYQRVHKFIFINYSTLIALVIWGWHTRYMWKSAQEK